MFVSHCRAALLLWKSPYARGALRVFKSGLRIGTVVVLVYRLPLFRPVGFIGILIHGIPVAVAESLERGEYPTGVLSHPRSIPRGGEMVRGGEKRSAVLEEGSRAGRSQRNATRVASDRFTRSPSAEEERRMAGTVHRKRKLRARAAWPLLRDRLARSRGHCIGTRFCRQWMDCVCDATKQYDIATHSLNNIMFLNTSFLALNVHFERTEVVFQIPSSVQ